MDRIKVKTNNFQTEILTYSEENGSTILVTAEFINNKFKIANIVLRDTNNINTKVICNEDDLRKLHQITSSIIKRIDNKKESK